jgi:hypothetical protein
VHVHQLVDQHVARGPYVARKLVAAAQQQGLAVGAAIGELGKLQLHAGHAFQRAAGSYFGQVGVVGDLQGVFGLNACGNSVGSNDFHSGYLGIL